MIWTTEKPTKPGWYWYASPIGRQSIVYIIIASAGNLYGFADGQAVIETDEGCLTDLDGEWAGPIPEPGRATTELFTLLADEMAREFISMQMVDLMVPYNEGLARADRHKQANSQDWLNTVYAMGGALMALEKLGYRIGK